MEMQYKFTCNVPDNYTGRVPLISGPESVNFAAEEFITVRSENDLLYVFQVRFDRFCSPFRQAQITGNILAVGLEEMFYLYDLSTGLNYLSLTVDGYFGCFVLNGTNFYVADASGIHCIGTDGRRIWHNDQLAIDGITINRFEDNKMYISAELDPPGGWESYVLDRLTGEKIT